MSDAVSPYLNRTARSLEEALADTRRLHAEGENGNGHGSNGGPAGNGNGTDHANGNGNGNGNGHGNGNGNGNGHRSADFRVNPFAGPGHVDPTLTFVEKAVLGRPELTKEIIEAALKIDPEKAQKILVAAMRANPQARDVIMKIARQRGSLRGQSMLGLFLAVFLYEMFGNNRKIEARERDEVDERRSAVTETYLAWFIAAAVQLSILFDTDSMQRFSDNLGIRLDFEDPLTTLSRLFDALEDLALPKIARNTPADDAENIRLSSVLTGVPPSDTNGSDRMGPEPGKYLKFLPGDFAAPNDLAPDDRTHPFRGPSLDLPRLFTLLPGGGLGMEGLLLTPQPFELLFKPDQPPIALDERPRNPDIGFGNGETPFFSGNETGNESGFITFFVYRTGDSSLETSAYFSTLDGTALAGQDYLSTSGFVQFAAGQQMATVTVQIIDDGVVEGTEEFTFLVSESPEKGIELGYGSSGVIYDDDKEQPEPVVWTLSGDLVTSEGETANYSIGYAGGPLLPGQTVSLELLINYGKGDGAADETDFSENFLASIQLAIDDLGPDSGVSLNGNVLTFTEGGATELAFALPLFLDAQIEGFENYTIMIANPSDGTILAGYDVVTTAIFDVTNFIAVEGDDDDNVLIGSSSQDFIQGFGGNDTLDGLGNADRLEGGDGADTFVLHFGKKSVAMPSVIVDFNAADGDKVQVADLLADVPVGDSIDQYARAVENNGNTILMIDRDGSESGSEFEAIAVFLGVTGVTAEQLLYPTSPDVH